MNTQAQAAERAAARLCKGMSHADYKRIIDEEYSRRSSYMAIAKPDGTFAVREVYSQGSDLHPIGNCRDFATFEEADQVARDMAAGKYPDIRPAGNYVSMR
jgi:hypothetical protein